MVHTPGLIEKQRSLKKQLSPNTTGKLNHQNRKKIPNLCKVPSCVKKENFFESMLGMPSQFIARCLLFSLTLVQ